MSPLRLEWSCPIGAGVPKVLPPWRGHLTRLHVCGSCTGHCARVLPSSADYEEGISGEGLAL